ncbi:MAG: hypothetical protein KAJ51_08965, partial [Thermoplasmata archaeon]|nr:hypothetical protein [Thermoplasmata archaeon]
VSVNIHLNNTVSFTPANNWFGGPEEFTFYANDTVFEHSDTINVTVQPVNDPPELRLTTTWGVTNGTIKSNTEIKVEQAQKLTLEPKAFDNDTANPVAPDTLYWNVTFYYGGSTNLTSLPENFTFDEATGMINYQPSNYDVGQFTINIKVRDREDPADIDIETDARNIAFTVSNRNDNPILVSLITKTSEYFINTTDFTLPELADEDSPFDFTANATDPDYSTAKGDVLMFSASNRFSLWPAIDPNKVKITVVPTNNDAVKGYIEGLITVKDEGKLEDFLRLTIPINNTNDPPTITYVGSNVVLASKLVHFIGAEAARVGQYLNFTIKGQDIDPADILNYDTENTSMTYGIDPELTIIQDPANKSALVAFKPSVLRGESTIILNFTVEDDGMPVYSDWVHVMIDIREVVIVEDKYTLTSNDCEKSYWDPENDVVTYERKTDDKISASKGGEKGLDIVSLESRKFNDDLVITVKCTQNLDELGLLRSLDVYVVKSTFRENGTHLKPENMNKTGWNLIPFTPLDEELYSGWLLDKFSASDYGGPSVGYESEIDGMTWTITMPLEDFENTFGVSHSTGFELFAVSYDGSELMYQEGDLTNLFGPKSYDSAGYYSATAPDIGQQPPGGGDGGTATSDAEEVLVYALIIIIIIAVIFIVVVAVL